MDSMRLLDITSLLSTLVRHRESVERSDPGQNLDARNAVSQENKLAAVDSSVLTGNQLSGSGTFTFSWSTNPDGSSTLDITLANSTDPTTSAGGDASSNFSLSLHIGADGKVSLPDGVQAGEQQITGQDFTYSKDGVLQLLSDLAERMGAQDQTQVDLSGKLDDKTQDMLKRLGLIDANGQATQLLQFLSDYAGLDRFKAGQQVSQDSNSGYGMSAKTLGVYRHLLHRLQMMAAAASTNNSEAAPTSATASDEPDGTTAPAASAADPSAGQAAASAIVSAQTAEDSSNAVNNTVTASTASSNANGVGDTSGEQGFVEIVLSLSDAARALASTPDATLVSAAPPDAAAEATPAAAGVVVPPSAATDGASESPSPSQGNAPDAPSAGSAQPAVASGTAPAVAGGAAASAVVADAASEALDLLLKALEAEQLQKEQDAAKAQQAAQQAAEAAKRAEQAKQDQAAMQQAERSAAQAKQAAEQAQQAAAQAKLAVEAAKLQQQLQNQSPGGVSTGLYGQ